MRREALGAKRRGKDHGLARFATAALILVLTGGMALAQSSDPALSGSGAGPVVSFSQRGVPADATAENGVIARDRALAAGRRAAWDRIAGAIGTSRTASDAQIEAMVGSIIIEEERITPTRYSGRITVNFNPGRVRAFADGAALAGPGADGRPPSDPMPRETDPRHQPQQAAGTSITAIARYATLAEWLEIRRRLSGGGPVSGMQVLAVATDRAQLRLSLRMAPNTAAAELARVGIMLAPPLGGPGDGWRLGLAGRI